jgi:hypothetical protein
VIFLASSSIEPKAGRYERDTAVPSTNGGLATYRQRDICPINR